MDLNKLREPFPAADIEWRVGRCGMSNGNVWAMVLAYVTARAIMDRLDEVVTPARWQNEFRPGPAGGVVCGLSINVADLASGPCWVTKWDGAENTDIEGVKGGLSGAEKRAAVQWGIGRYLYKLPEGWATTHTDDVRGHYKKGARRGALKDKTPFAWYPPAIAAEFLPKVGPHPLAASLEGIELESNLMAWCGVHGAALRKLDKEPRAVVGAALVSACERADVDIAHARAWIKNAS